MTPLPGPAPAAGGLGQLDDAALMDRVSGRDPDALAEVYRRHGAACYRLARQITVDAGLAEDAVQEAFLGLWRHPAGFQSGRGSLSAWLLGLTHHKSVDAVRRETSQRNRERARAAELPLLPPAEADPADLTWRALRAAEVRAAVSDLPPAQQQALALAYFGGYTQREIAELTGVPLGTVKTRTLAAMRRLRLRLAPLASLAREGSS